MEVETTPDQWEKRSVAKYSGAGPGDAEAPKVSRVLQPVSPAKCEEVAGYVADRLEDWEPPFDD